MQILIDIITLALACFLLPAIAAPPATHRCVPDSKVLGTLPKNFTLKVLFQDDRGQVDLKISKPVIFGSYETVSGAESIPLIVGSAKAKAEVFTLKENKLLGTFNEEGLGLDYEPLSGFGFENPSYERNPDGPRILVLGGTQYDPPYNFTAVQACDRYGRGFLRLGQNRGELNIT